MTTLGRHLALRLSSVPVVSTVEIQRAVSPEETLDRKDPDVLLTLTMGLGLTGGNKRNINFRMRPQPGGDEGPCRRWLGSPGASMLGDIPTDCAHWASQASALSPRSASSGCL